MSALARTTAGDIAIPLQIERDLATLTRRKIIDCLNFWLGTWFLNTAEGTPWLLILGRGGLTISQRIGLIRQVILQVPAVQSVTDLTVNVDRQTQQLQYQFSAVLDDGTTIDGGAGVPFIVNAPASPVGSAAA